MCQYVNTTIRFSQVTGFFIALHFSRIQATNFDFFFACWFNRYFYFFVLPVKQTTFILNIITLFLFFIIELFSAIKIYLMETLVIQYQAPKAKRYAAVIIGIFFLAVSLAAALHQVVYLNKIDLVFYLSIAGILFSGLLVVLFSIGQPKPLLTIDSEGIAVNFPEQHIAGKIEWLDIAKISIGISHLKMQTISDKVYEINLESLKYNDLRNIKTKIIEVCESKNIPYEND